MRCYAEGDQAQVVDRRASWRELRESRYGVCCCGTSTIQTRLRYFLAFGQPRREVVVEFLSADRTDEELLQLTARLRIDLSPLTTANDRCQR
jgi:hypothetical protein